MMRILLVQLPGHMIHFDTISIRIFDRAVIGAVTQVVIARPAGINFKLPGHTPLPDLVHKQGLGKRRTADVAKTNKKYFHTTESTPKINKPHSAQDA